MLALFVKIVGALFFAYISIDSFYKMGIIKREVEDDLLNPKTGKVMRGRALRNGLLFLVLALLAFASVWIRVAPLGE